MTTWVENPRSGRDRGPAAVLRAWVEVLVRPERFFVNGVAPGDQAPGLVFGVLVALVYAGTWIGLSPSILPDIGAGVGLTAVLVLLAVALFVAPATLHLTAALQTVLLIPLAPDRGGVSETVQLLAYAAAPCVFAGLPVPELRALCAVYGAALLIVGVRTVHRTTTLRAVLAGAVPAALVFGYGFRGFGALVTVAEQWYII